MKTLRSTSFPCLLFSFVTFSLSIKRVNTLKAQTELYDNHGIEYKGEGIKDELLIYAK